MFPPIRPFNFQALCICCDSLFEENFAMKPMYIMYTFSWAQVTLNQPRTTLQ
jgi:hypothetical protein